MEHVKYRIYNSRDAYKFYYATSESPTEQNRSYLETTHSFICCINLNKGCSNIVLQLTVVTMLAIFLEDKYK